MYPITLCGSGSRGQDVLLVGQNHGTPTWASVNASRALLLLVNESPYFKLGQYRLGASADF